jgi:hypothetical protein
MISQVNHGPPPLLIIDLGAAFIAAAVAFGWPMLGASFFARWERGFAVLAAHKLLAAFVVGFSVLLLRVAILPIYGIPIPFNVDDFSFLLSADTFAHGRLTNPTPAMWTHFETIHVTMVPTYQSMYFPGQGLLMAASQVVFGHPWWGVLLSSALMCAALTWALQAWIPANWALLGGFIAVLRLGLFSYWTNTYHAAGSLCALAGALVLGSLPRLKKTGRMRYGSLMAIGIAILEVTRPYEGVLLCLSVAVALVHWVWKGKRRPPLRALARGAVLPMLVILASSVWLGIYDLKAFGKATTLPYTVDRAEYAAAPYYVWQHPRSISDYRHAIMRQFYQVEEMESVRKIQSSLQGFVRRTLLKPYFVLMFYSNFILLAPILMLRRVLLDRRTRFLVLCVGVLAAGLAIEIFLLPHYVAPFLVAFYAIGLQAMRHLRLWKPEGRLVGLGMVRMMVASCVLLAGLRLFAQPLHLATSEWPPANWNLYWFGPEHFGSSRRNVEVKLEGQPGPQLAIVRYGPGHEALDEWVYNAANLNDSKVVWAREMDVQNNLELVSYFKDRTVWLVEPDEVPVRVTRYQKPDGLSDSGNRGF